MKPAIYFWENLWNKIPKLESEHDGNETIKSKSNNQLSK